MMIPVCRFSCSLYSCFKSREKNAVARTNATYQAGHESEQRIDCFTLVWELSTKSKKAQYVHLLELNLFQHDQCCAVTVWVFSILPDTHTHTHIHLLCAAALLEIVYPQRSYLDGTFLKGSL